MFKIYHRSSLFLLFFLYVFLFQASAAHQTNAAAKGRAEMHIPKNIGKVIVVKNKVEALRNSQRFPLKRKSPIQKGDEISTGNKARTQFRLTDGTLFTLGENTSLKVNHYLFNGSDATPKNAIENAKHSALFTLTKGAFRAITGKLTQVKSPRFNVKTPLGTIGIRGTDFWGGYLEPNKIDVFLVSGEHSVIVENEFGRIELKHAGEGTTIESGKAPSKPKKWPQAKVERAISTVKLPH